MVMVGRRGCCVLTALLFAFVVALFGLFLKRHALLYYANVGDFRVTVKSTRITGSGGSKWENFPPPDDSALGVAQGQGGDLEGAAGGFNPPGSDVQQPVASQPSNQRPISSSQGAGSSSGKGAELQPSVNVIEANIRKLGDMRSPECVAEKYDVTGSVTLVVDFNNFQFYSVKATLDSVRAAGVERIAEIVVVDDGTARPYIVDESVRYVAALPKARLVRRPTQLGSLRSRIDALASASTDTIVFLDHNVVVSKGWLEPLLDLLAKEPRVIAVPHYDQITDPVKMEYRRTPPNIVATWMWDMAIRMRHSFDPRILPSTRYVVSPALRGNAFAVRKAEFSAYGGFDERFEEGGGEYLDLSMRAWLCGGGVRIASCSRVAVINLEVPVRVRTRRNMRRIANSWFGESGDAVMQLNGGKASAALGGGPEDKYKGCRNLTWFLREVKNDTKVPTVYSAHFGALRVHSGRCARVGADARIDLDPCGVDFSSVEPWEMTHSGRIRTPDGRCVTAASSAYLLAQPCQRNDTKQDWTLSDRQELINVWSGYCARHVTDPDKNKTGRQIAMAQLCDGQPSHNDQFKRWSFVPHG